MKHTSGYDHCASDVRAFGTYAGYKICCIDSFLITKMKDRTINQNLASASLYKKRWCHLLCDKCSKKFINYEYTNISDLLDIKSRNYWLKPKNYINLNKDHQAFILSRLKEVVDEKILFNKQNVYDSLKIRRLNYRRQLKEVKRMKMYMDKHFDKGNDYKNIYFKRFKQRRKIINPEAFLRAFIKYIYRCVELESVTLNGKDYPGSALYKYVDDTNNHNTYNTVEVNNSDDIKYNLTTNLCYDFGQLVYDCVAYDGKEYLHLDEDEQDKQYKRLKSIIKKIITRTPEGIEHSSHRFEDIELNNFGHIHLTNPHGVDCFDKEYSVDNGCSLYNLATACFRLRNQKFYESFHESYGESYIVKTDDGYNITLDFHWSDEL